MAVAAGRLEGSFGRHGEEQTGFHFEVEMQLLWQEEGCTWDAHAKDRATPQR